MKPFQFKQFSIEQDQCSMKVGTDGVLLGAWADVDNAKSALDIGTGTGVISIMLAQRNTEVQVDAVEIDQVACEQAQTNFANSPFADRLSAKTISIQDYIRESATTYDLIVSNPPFFSGGTFSQSQERNQVRHTVKMPHNALLQAARRLLNKNGKFCVVLPLIEGLRFQELAEQVGLFTTKITEVKPKAEKSVERLLLQMEWQEKTLQKNQLVIQKDARNDWTEEYIQLTGDFYLKM
ncbi:MAG: tRNA1(Val) (adenine(37)-N6)-methyltransferase [Saprospiraceae bacterium]